MTKPINAIIFDLGNVLIGWDAHLLYKRFLPDREAVTRFLEEIRFMEWNAQQDAGRSFKEGVADLSRQFPQYADLIQAYDTYWEESLTEPYHDTIEIVRTLKDAGWSLYLLSNFSLEKFKLIEHKHRVFEWLEDKIISGEHRTVKPQAEIFHITLQRIGRKAEECLFIDDSLPNIQTANSLGFQTIHYYSPTQLKEELIKLRIKGITP
jgi:2-haloacid dehalogenase